MPTTSCPTCGAPIQAEPGAAAVCPFCQKPATAGSGPPPLPPRKVAPPPALTSRSATMSIPTGSPPAPPQRRKLGPILAAVGGVILLAGIGVAAVVIGANREPDVTPPAGPPTEAEAVTRLADLDPARRAEAIRIVAKGSPRTHLPALLAALDGATPEVEAAVAEVLDKIGPPRAEQAAKLEKALAPGRSGRAVVVKWVKSAPGSEPAFVPPLLAALSDADPALTDEIGKTLAGSGPPAADADEAVTKALRGPKRAVVVRYLAGLKAGGRPFVPNLLALLPTSDAELGVAVGDALDVIGPPPADAAPALARVLSDPVGRPYALRAFATTITPPPEAVTPLVGLLSDADPIPRKLAATAIGRAGTPARADGLAPLLLLTGDREPEVRAAATAAVDGWKPFVAADRPALETALAGTAPTPVRLAAANGLAGLLRGQEVDLLAKFDALLEDPAPDLRLAAVTALSAGPRTRRAVRSRLKALIADPNPAIRMATVRAVASDDDRTEADFRELVARLDTESNPGVTAELITAVRQQLRPADVEAIRVLYRRGGAVGKAAALDALAKSAKADDFADLLKTALTDADPAVQAAACRVYAAGGPKPADLSRIVATLSGRPTDELVQAVVAALAAGGPAGRTELLNLLARPGGTIEQRRAVCKQLAGGAVPPEVAGRIFGWAESGSVPPDEAGLLLAKLVVDQPKPIADGLIKLGELPQLQGRILAPPYSSDIRGWVVRVYARMDPAKVHPDHKKRIRAEVRHAARNDPDPTVRAAASAEAPRWDDK